MNKACHINVNQQSNTSISSASAPEEKNTEIIPDQLFSEDAYIVPETAVKLVEAVVLKVEDKEKTLSEKRA